MNLRLGLFTFRNDDVVLLAGDPDAIAALGTHLQRQFEAGHAYVAMHALAQVSTRFPARLFAVRDALPSMEADALTWPCGEGDIHALGDMAAGTAPSQKYFALATTPPYFLVTCSGHYDAAWWATYA